MTVCFVKKKSVVNRKRASAAEVSSGHQKSGSFHRFCVLQQRSSNVGQNPVLGAYTIVCCWARLGVLNKHATIFRDFCRANSTCCQQVNSETDARWCNNNVSNSWDSSTVCCPSLIFLLKFKPEFAVSRTVCFVLFLRV